MAQRRKTRTVKIGSVKMGSSSPVVIQSMLKVPTTDISKCVKQIKQLTMAGCQLVRISTATKADTASFAKIVQKVSSPLIADIHFSAMRAIEAIEAGAAKIRLNPGNIQKRKDVQRIIDAAKKNKTAIRIGINEASIRNLKTSDIPPTKRVGLMLNKMKQYVRFFETRKFDALILSAKSSDTLRTIEINRHIAKTFDYPIHIGLTHTGLIEDAQIPSAVVTGTLLAEGIGDTIRISAADDPLVEVRVTKQILTSLGLYKKSLPELIVCPMCSRAESDVIKLARQVKKSLSKINKPLRIAVMGCIVNGPGEAADADVAVCLAKNKGYIYRNGSRIKTASENTIIPLLLNELEKLTG
jgi:(E)-4-hydroxy-3-methylbut-2-enyl-diphosphate synthase